MSKYKYNVIYIWAIRCPSDNCIPPSIAANEAEEKGYKLWVVLDYYDPQIIGVNFNMPIYSIKNTIYKTDYCRKYIKSFLKDLGWEETENEWGRFYLFERDNFVSQKQRIADF